MHPEALDPAQIDLAERLGPLVEELGFYLADGTSAALQLGHRQSVDLDYFVDHAFGDGLALAARIKEVVPEFKIVETAPGTVHGEAQGVPISFIEFRYPLLGPTIRWPEGHGAMANLDDFTAMKLSAIAQRGHRKDFYDVYALGISHKPLPGLIASYLERFGILNPIHVLIGLIYFADADRQVDPKILWSVSWQGVKETISIWVADFEAKAKFE